MTGASALFDVFAARPRRRILILLLDSDSIGVSAAIDTRGQSTASGTANPQQKRRQRTAKSSDEGAHLYHVHLPKLEDEGFVEWDRETDTVSRGPRYPAIEPALRVLSKNADKFPLDML